MNILIDIGHSAHVHLFRHCIKLLKQKRHNIYVTVKDIPAAKELLNQYEIPFIDLGGKSDSIFLKGLNQIIYNLRILKLVREHNVNLGIGSSINLAHASKLSQMQSVVFDDDDDEVEPLFTKFAHPFCDALLSPEALLGKRKRKDTIYYAGYHELAYLHPKRFHPDLDILKEAGLQAGENYFVLRFNVFKAHHDIGVQGLSIENKRKLIELLKPHGKIFITTEREIDPEFAEYKIKIEPQKIHSFLYYATMFIGDSQTMTSEAAVLGTPAVRSNSFVGKISYLEEQEHKYGLTYGFLPGETDKLFKKIDELLHMPDPKQEWQKRRKRMLVDKIDVTALMIWFIENYPESTTIMQNNPCYQFTFK
jgi:hypothetical protein